MSAKVTFSPEEILLGANALFRTEQSKDLRGVIAEKIEDLQHYDVLAMERVVAICYWGRSGSFLLASYLDGHEDVVMLPATRGHGIYNFFNRYRSLSLRDKLIAYPAFTGLWDSASEEPDAVVRFSTVISRSRLPSITLRYKLFWRYTVRGHQNSWRQVGLTFYSCILRTIWPSAGVRQARVH